MISPTSFTDFSWPASALSGAAQNAMAVTAANNQAATVDSFQDILAQAVTPESASQTRSTNSGNTSSTSLALSSLPIPSGATGASQTQAGSASSAAQAAARHNIKGATRPSPQRGGGSKSAHTTRKESAKNNGSTGTSPAEHEDDQSASDIKPVQIAAQPGDGSGKSSKTGATPAQHALPAAAATVLGGAKNLAGAAFAMHITPTNKPMESTKSEATPADNASPAPPVSGDNGASADLTSSANTTAVSSDAHAANPGEAAAAGTLLAAFPVAFSNADTQPALSSNKAEPQIVTSTSDVGEIPDENPGGPPQTVRSVQVQLAGNGESRVDLRLVEHGGGLSVSVRSSDAELTKGLQENLPELSNRLAAEKYDTHTFVPAAAETTGSGSASSDSSSSQSSGQSHQQSSGRSFSQDSSSPGGNNGGQERGSQDQTAKWWRQMAALGKMSSIANTSWFAPSPPGVTSVNSD